MEKAASSLGGEIKSNFDGLTEKEKLGVYTFFYPWIWSDWANLNIHGYYGC